MKLFFRRSRWVSAALVTLTMALVRAAHAQDLEPLPPPDPPRPPPERSEPPRPPTAPASPAEEKPKSAEIQVASGPQVQTSSWRGDASISQSLRLGVRFKEVITIDVLTRLGYGVVDERMLTYLSLGATVYPVKLAHGRICPFGRLAIVHQHEEPTSALRHDPFGALFGVGDGIRHRGGFASSLGVDFVVARGQSSEFLLGTDVNGTWFPDPRGPALYYGGGLWAGLNYSL